jgi:hypothetical protein
MVYNYDEPLDTSSALYQIYKYFWNFPHSRVIPNEIMPVHHAIYYTFTNVKSLRDGTDWPELTLSELEEMFHEEFPGWEKNWSELPDEAYAKLGLEVPVREYLEQDDLCQKNSKN